MSVKLIEGFHLFIHNFWYSDKWEI
jgi:hypothetical protein